MKKLLSTLAIVVMMLTSYTQEGLNFTAQLTNEIGVVAKNSNIELSISIYDGTTTKYEVYNIMSDSNGMVHQVLGSTIMNQVNWSSGLVEYTITYNVDGGNDIILQENSKFTNTPYSYHSNTANELVGGESDPTFNTWLNNDYEANSDTKLIESEVDDMVSNNGYITEEVQALSISNDTIFLDGGSFVKLPTGNVMNQLKLINEWKVDDINGFDSITHGQGYGVARIGDFLVNTESYNNSQLKIGDYYQGGYIVSKWTEITSRTDNNGNIFSNIEYHGMILYGDERDNMNYYEASRNVPANGSDYIDWEFANIEQMKMIFANYEEMITNGMPTLYGLGPVEFVSNPYFMTSDLFDANNVIKVDKDGNESNQSTSQVSNPRKLVRFF